MNNVRNALIVLGDQLDTDSALFQGAAKKRDVIIMAEASSEAEYVWSHKQRITLFLAAMRHFRTEKENAGWQVHYRKMDDPKNEGDLSAELRKALHVLRPEKAIVLHPGEWRVREAVERAAKDAGVPLEVRADAHFYLTPEEFRSYADGRKSLRMEFFYREMRKRFDVLMEGGKPAGGEWNYDEHNRDSFGREGPDKLPPPPSFEPDATTRAVIDLVNRRFSDHPGETATFRWPVQRGQALEALQSFIRERLPVFGRFQDALWTGEPFLYHSLLSSSLNLKLLRPREVVDAAQQAWRDGKAPLAAVEGFIRQILGWREYVRGVYWLHMPDYIERNELNASEPLPGFYWTAETPMNCLRETIGQTLRHGYAHHIQRLMVTGLYALLLGVHPRRLHEWYLAVYVDAVEWVELPNTLGMSQFADGGVMASKPYVATGKYLRRMSNYCAGCRFNPDERTGDNACPFTTLYWDFLLRNESALQSVGRLNLQLKNLRRLSREEAAAIRKGAEALRRKPSAEFA